MGDTLLWGDLLLEGHRWCNTLVWGQQCCTTCMALQLLPNYSSHHPNLSKHDGSCSLATAAGPHWQVILQWNLPMLILMGDTSVMWWRHVSAPQAFFSERACTASTLLPSTIVCCRGDSAPASLTSHCQDTPFSQPRARRITPLLPPQPPASCSSDPVSASCDPAPPPSPAPRESGRLHSDYKMHPHFPPKFGGTLKCVL